MANVTPPVRSVVLRDAMRYISKIIMSFGHKGLRRFDEAGSASGIQAAHRKRLRFQLAALSFGSMGVRARAVHGDSPMLFGFITAQR